VTAQDVEPYVDAVSVAPLLARFPLRPRITAEKKIPELGITEWKLANGVRVI